MSEPLVFQHGAAAMAFDVAAGAWFLFELLMTVRQRRHAGHRPARDPTAFVLIACIAARSVGIGGSREVTRL